MHQDRESSPSVRAGRQGLRRGFWRQGSWRRDFLRRSLLLPGLALAALIAASGFQAKADSVAVRSALHPGFARIVFDWPGLITASAAIEGEQLQVRFPRPLTVNLASIPGRLKGYVLAAHRNADGRSVTFDLARPLRLKEAVRANLVVLDLLPTGAVPSEPAAQPKSAAQPEPAVPSEPAAKPRPAAKPAAPVKPRQAVKPAAPAKLAERSGPPARPLVRPASPESPRPKPAPAEKPQSVPVPPAGAIAVTAEPSAEGSRIIFHLPHRRRFILHQYGTRLVMIFEPPLAFDLEALNRQPPPGLTGAEAVRAGRRATVTLHLASPERARFFRAGAAIIIAVRAPKRPATPPAPPAPAPVVAGPSLPKMPVLPVKVATLPPAARPLAPGEVEPVVAGASLLSPGVRLSFPWREPVPAAVFQRGNILWLAFDRPGSVDFDALKAVAAAGILNARQLAVPGATVLRLELKPGLGPVASRDGSQWVVDVKPATAAALARPIDVRSEPQARSGPRVFLPVTGLGHEIRFTDPDVGDQILVMPLTGDGFGVNLAHEFPQFTLPATAQGIVVRPTADGILLQPLQNGLQIAAAGGLLVSAAPKGEVSDRWLFHIDDWRGALSDFDRDEGHLLLKVALAQPGARTQARRDLARFYFANHFAAEAEAVLIRLKDRDPRAADSPEFHSLLGAVLVDLRHFPEAASVLGGADLVFDPQAALWRGLIAAHDGHWPQAIKELGQGARVLEAYPPDWRGRFLLAGAKAALATGNKEGAAATLAALEGAKLSGDEQAEATLLRGRLEGLEGKKITAAALYAKVAASPMLPAAAQARLDLVNTDLALRKITPAQAIEQLERLRFAWRGDATELAVERRLGELYIANGKPRQGLLAWRRAIRDFPTSPLAAELAADSKAEFHRLFLDGGAKKLTPIEALAVYYDFRDLTPQGSDGDAMIRNLADRLVSLDLLDRAADLLNYQVTRRLSGEEKARVGARLAVVQLLNDKPEGALTALSESLTTPLPAALTLERLDLQARAEADQGKTDAALTLIKGDTSLAADKLRADINWRAKRWPAAAASLWVLLSNRDKNPAPLDETERQTVMQLAVALSLGGDETGLAQLRSRFGSRLDGTPEAEGFRVITSVTDRNDSDYRQLTSAVANVKQLESFMASYRDRLQKGKLSAID